MQFAMKYSRLDPGHPSDFISFCTERQREGREVLFKTWGYIYHETMPLIEEYSRSPPTHKPPFQRQAGKRNLASSSKTLLMLMPLHNYHIPSSLVVDIFQGLATLRMGPLLLN